jgi:hypothetical protein
MRKPSSMDPLVQVACTLSCACECACPRPCSATFANVMCRAHSCFCLSCSVVLPYYCVSSFMHGACSSSHEACLLGCAALCASTISSSVRAGHWPAGHVRCCRDSPSCSLAPLAHRHDSQAEPFPFRNSNHLVDGFAFLWNMHLPS